MRKIVLTTLANFLFVVLPAFGAESSGTTLKGTVVQVEVTLNDLRDARLSISRLRKANANLYDEVTRQQMTMSYNPNVIGSTVLMIPTPSFSGPYLPPRKKWVDETMADIGPIINLFKEDVDTAIESNRRNDISDRGRKSMDPIREEAFALVKQSFDIYRKLEQLTSATAYDNRAISSATMDMDKQMKKLDSTLKRGIKILQKEAKSGKKA